MEVAPLLGNNHLSINRERESSASGRQLIFALGINKHRGGAKKTKKLIKDAGGEGDLGHLNTLAIKVVANAYVMPIRIPDWNSCSKLAASTTN